MPWYKDLIPDVPTRVPVLSGPFRGARIVLRPRSSMRKILGIYEQELNPWLNLALRRVGRVIDVGANDGYFSIGCAAAFRRMSVSAEIVAIEPSQDCCQFLERSARAYRSANLRLRVIRSFAGCESTEDCMTLDGLGWEPGAPGSSASILIKIDVEGAEEAVLDGAVSLMTPQNLFLIEIHRREFLETIPARFAKRGLRLRRLDQRPLPLLGREVRSEANWWLVSELA